MPQVQVLANPLNDRQIPIAARFPGEVEVGDVDGSNDTAEEVLQVGNVFFRLLEARGTLKQDGARAQSYRTRERCFPGLLNNRCKPKVPGFLPLKGSELFLQSPVGRTSGIVRDQLPGLQHKLKVGRGGRTPAFEGGNLWWLVEGVLDFDARE